MILNFEMITKLCIKFNITIEQFYFMYAIVYKEWNLVKEYTNVNGGLSLKKVKDLEKKSLLLNYNKDETDEKGNPVVMISLLYATPEFEQSVFIDTQAAFDKLFDIFPDNFSEGNQKSSHHEIVKYSTDKKKNGLHLWFAKKHRNDPFELDRILNLTNYAVRNNLINMTLELYIRIGYWNTIQVLQSKKAIVGKFQ